MRLASNANVPKHSITPSLNMDQQAFVKAGQVADIQAAQRGTDGLFYPFSCLFKEEHTLSHITERYCGFQPGRTAAMANLQALVTH